MIDPLRPYWPTNRSIAGLLVRGACLAVAAGTVAFGSSRSFALVVVVFTALGQAGVLVFEWMELRRTARSGLLAGGIVLLLLLALVAALLAESRWILVSSTR